MKKQLFLLAALVISAMTFATTITIDGSATGFTSSYPTEEKTVTVDGVNFLYLNAKYSAKNTPTAVAAVAKTFIQMKSAKDIEGQVYICNESELTMKNIQVYLYSDIEFTLYAGAAQKPTEALTKPAATDGTVKVVDKDDESVTKDIAVKIYTFDVEGKKYFKLDAGDNGTKALYISKIVISDEAIEIIHPSSVALDKAEASMAAFETLQLTATVLPENAQNKSVTWSSSDEEIATVSETGLVSAWAEGKATITVKSVDGEKTATCALTVTAPQKSVFGRIKPSELKDKDTVIITMTVDSIGIPMVLCADEVKSAPGPKAVAGGIIEGTIVPATDNMVFVADVSEAGIRFRPVLKEIEDSVYLYVYGGESTNDGVRVAKVGKTDTYGNTWVIDAETGYLKATYTYIKNKGKETETQEEYTRYLGEVDGVFKAYKLDAKGNLSSKIKGQTLKLFVKGAEPPVEYYFNTAWNGGAAQWVLGMDAGEFTNPNAQLPGAWVVDGKWGGADVLVNTKPAEEGALKFLRVDGEGKAQILYMDVRENCTDCSAEPEVGTEVEIVYCTPEFTMNPNLTGRLVVMYMSVDPHSIENVIINGTSAEKIIIDGQLYIIRDGVMYNVQGARVR